MSLIEDAMGIIGGIEDAIRKQLEELDRLKAALRAQPEIDTSATDRTVREYGEGEDEARPG